MRKILLFYSLYCLIGAINSQNLNIARHIGIDFVGNILSINSKCYYWESGIDNCCGYQSSVYSIGYNGAVLWKKNFQVNGRNTVKKLISTPDQCLALLFHSEGCDTGPVIYYLTKFDTLGTTLFQDTVAGMQDLVCVSDSSFYGIGYTDLYH